jgi:pimeloyl-ACP methyl ester carboxylesterase
VFPAWWVSHVEHDWQEPHFRAFFARFAEHYTVVRYDRPGVGLSDRDVAPRTLEAETELLAALIDHLDAEAVSFFCVSCGGPPAIRYAARNPDRVRAIVFANSFARGSDLGSEPVRNALIGLVRASWGMGSKALADIFFPDADGQTTLDFSRGQRERADVERAADLLKLTFSMDATADLAQVRARTLVIHRRGDRACPFEAGRRLAAELPDATFAPRDGRVHLPWVAGDAIADAAMRFFRGEAVAGDAAREPNEAAAHAGARPDACMLDIDARAIGVHGRSIVLTPLEFGVMRQLVQRNGAVVTRDDLLERVWKTPFAGSNKVEAVVRTLRKKLGAAAGLIETVTGHGYRYAGAGEDRPDRRASR